nr:unnamed protein product [Callosobruchus analis]
MIDILDIIDSDAEVDTKVYDTFQDYIQNKAETGEVKDKSNFSIPDCNMYYNESHLNKCDGVVVYVKHSISVIESLVQSDLKLEVELSGRSNLEMENASYIKYTYTNIFIDVQGILKETRPGHVCLFCPLFSFRNPVPTIAEYEYQDKYKEWERGEILGLLDGDYTRYLSDDSVETKDDGERLNFTTEFFNSINPSGMLQHRLRLKVGTAAMLLRNLNTKKAVCNGNKPKGDCIINEALAAAIPSKGGKNTSSMHFVNVQFSGTDFLIPHVQNTAIKQVKAVKYLGFGLDCKLTLPNISQGRLVKLKWLLKLYYVLAKVKELVFLFLKINQILEFENSKVILVLLKRYDLYRSWYLPKPSNLLPLPPCMAISVSSNMNIHSAVSATLAAVLQYAKTENADANRPASILSTYPVLQPQSYHQIDISICRYRPTHGSVLDEIPKLAGYVKER